MNELEFERHLKEGASFVYNPDTNEFELAPKRKENEGEVIIFFPSSEAVYSLEEREKLKNVLLKQKETGLSKPKIEDI